MTLQAAMAKLPEPPRGAHAPEWSHWRHQLWELAQAQPPESFMSWPPIYHTMLVSHWSMDYQWAQLLADDEQRWRPAVLATGESTPADLQPGTAYSKNLINTAYHLLMWERCTSKRVADLGSIVEVGGGYGAMALVCWRLGFGGRYTIYDLPEFSLLQRWWLGKHGVKARCVTALPLQPEQAGLLVGVYSLSEMPFDERCNVLEAYPAGSYLLVYSHDWQAWHNRPWFGAWAQEQGLCRWWDWRMERENDRPDYYRVGVRV
jgi:hypothetical protein